MPWAGKMRQPIIRQPQDSIASNVTIPVSLINVICIPLVVFDNKTLSIVVV